MRIDPFEIPVYQYSISDWDTIKSNIIKILDGYPLGGDVSTEQPEGNLWSDYSSTQGGSTTEYKQDIEQQILEPLIRFGSDIGAMNPQIVSMWHTKLLKGIGHPPHNHPTNQYAGVLYLQYDSLHTPTRLYSPFRDFFTKDVKYWQNDETKEGDMIFYPADLMHDVLPHLSTSPREVIAMNITVKNY